MTEFGRWCDTVTRQVRFRPDRGAIQRELTAHYQDHVRDLERVERGEEALGKPAGRYVTLTMDGLVRREEGAFPRAARAVGGVLAQLMDGVPGRGLALVVGLGNRAITPDAIGPKVHEHTLVTRHLVEQIPEHFGAFRPVASLSAGVLGTTGMESAELIQAVCRRLSPACVVAVDALASRSLKRLCRTVQLSDTGISPGSGVGNARFALNAETLGVPVVAVGVPTVVDGATLCADLLARAGRRAPPWPPICWGRSSSRPWGRAAACWSPPRTSTARWTTWPRSLGTASAWPSSPASLWRTWTCC